MYSFLWTMEVNEDPVQDVIADLSAQVASLKSQVEEMKSLADRNNVKIFSLCKELDYCRTFLRPFLDNTDALEPAELGFIETSNALEDDSVGAVVAVNVEAEQIHYPVVYPVADAKGVKCCIRYHLR